MNQILSRLYAARRELTRLIIATAPGDDGHERLERLLDARDALVWEINRIMLSQLTASVAQIDIACDEIDAATTRLQAVAARIEQVEEAIGIANGIIGIAAGIAGKVV